MQRQIQATLENTKLNDILEYEYTNAAGEYHGPFYFKICGYNTHSWKVKSVDIYGNETKQHQITQIRQKDKTRHVINVKHIHFGERRNRPNYISWKHTPLVIQPAEDLEIAGHENITNCNQVLGSNDISFDGNIACTKSKL